MAVDFRQAWKLARKPTEGTTHRITVSEIVAIGSCPFEIAIVRDGNGKLWEVQEDNTLLPNGLKNRWDIRVRMKLSIKVKEKNGAIKRRVRVVSKN